MKTRKQSLSRTAISKTPNPGLTRICLAVSAAILSPMAMSPTVWANPDGASVVNGQVSLQSPSTGRLEITNSPGSIIDWKSFSIGVNELTRFNQVNNLSSVLNRVTGGNASEILGQLRSNGQVFLINPNGLVIGNGATIDTAGFIASTLDISNQDFLNGKLQFKGEGGAIVNRGFIHAGKNGEVVLIAPKIENHGVIEAEDGQIILAAGREVTLSSLDLDHISFRVQAPGDSAINLGKLLSRNGAVGLFADQVINKGIISANRVSRNASGQIVLHGTSSTRVSGSVEATGSGTSGGDIKILGDDISLTGAQIGASGSSGGGEILIGGEYQGRGQTPTAQKTTIDTGSQLHADATGNGEGGTIIAWSETTTTVDGLLTARGGPLGGDGGFIETSGRGQLNFSRPADVSAANGKGGTWLLDPENINIDSGKAGSIESALNKGSNVTVKTSDGGGGEGNITVSAGIEKSEGDDATLALIAHNRIDVNAPIRSTSNQLSVKLRAGSKIAVNASIDTHGGSLSSSLTGVAPPPPLLTEPEAADAEPAAVDSDTATDSTSTRAWADTQDSYVPVEPAPEPMPEPVTAPVIEPLNADEVIVADVIIEPTLAVDIPADSELPEITLDAAITTGGGNITVDAGEQGTLLVHGDVDASNTSSGAHGGTIQLLGNHVGLFDEATVDASGDGAGGTILIGGDQQGLNPDVRNASAVFLGENTQVRADALTEGDGGRVIVFAEDSARIHGEISATGGAISGDGGFIETSGKRGFSITRTPDASAPNGAGGTWLIDPYNITVVNGGGNTDINTSAPFDPTGDDARLGSDLVRTALAAGGEVVITTGSDGMQDGNINWAASMDMNNSAGGPPNSGHLTLNAHNDIVITGSIYDSDIFSIYGDERIRGLSLNADYGTGGTAGDGNGQVFIRSFDNGPSVNITIAGAGPGEGFLDVTGTDFDVRSIGDYGGDVNIMADSSISVNLHNNAGGQLGDVTIEGSDSSYFNGYSVRIQTDTFNVGSSGANGATNFDLRGGSVLDGHYASVTANSIDITLAGNLVVTSGTSGSGSNNNASMQGGYVHIAANDISVSGSAFGRASIYADSAGSNISSSSMTVYAPIYDGSAVVSLGDSGELTVDELTLDNGELNSELDGPFGDSVITVNREFNWFGGAIYGSGELNTNGVGEISGPDDRYLGDRIWNQNADIDWIDGDIFLSGDVTINNAGTLNAQSDNSFSVEDGSHEFINTGTFTKSGDSGTTTFDEDIFFRNRGMVNANNGTIDFRGGFAQTAGVTTLDGGTITDSASNLMTFAGGGINGSGTIMAGMNLDAVTVAPGFSPGVLHITGNLVTSNATIFDMEIESATSFDQVIVDGTASLAGTMNILISNGFEPDNISFDLITSMDGNSGTFSTFNPPGTAATATELYNPNDYTVEFGAAPPPLTPPRMGQPPSQPPPPPPIVDDGPDEPLMFTPDLTPIVVVLIEQDDPDVPGEFDPDSPVSLLRSSLLQCL